MPDLWENQSNDDEFALPGDEERVANVERPRGEDGKFVAKTPVAEEGAPPVEPPDDLETGSAADTPPDDISLLRSQLEQLEKRLADKEEFIGRQTSEVGELRKLITEQAAPPAYQQVDQEQLQDYLEANPTQIPYLANRLYQEGNRQVLDQVLVAWEELDRVSARRFQRIVDRNDILQDIQRTQSQAVQTQSSWQQTAAQFAQSHPDFDQYAPVMQELAELYPNMLRVLESGDQRAQVEVLDFLYTKARDRQADTLAEHAQQVARRTAQQARQAEQDSSVVTATRTSDTNLTFKERLAKEWAEMDDPLKTGWNIG